MLALALVLRVAWAVLVPVVPLSDSLAYDVFARNLATHGVYGWTPDAPTAFWPVGTSFIYSLLFRAFGHSYLPVVVLNVALGLSIVALTMMLATRWFGARVGTVAGTLIAAWPSQVQFTTVLASELPFMALLLGATWTWFGETVTLRRAVLTGALLAAASYFRPTALLLPVAFAAALAFQTRRWVPVGWAAVLGLTMAVLIAPWSVRNTRLFGRIVLISTNAGTTSWMGNNAETTGEFMRPPYPPGMNEADSNEYFGQEARKYILDHPARFVGRTMVKLLRLHERESIGITWNSAGLERFGGRTVFALKLVSNIYWWVCCSLAIAGTVILTRREGWRTLAHPALAIWGYFAAVHAITLIQDRYHFPSIPFIATLAAYAMVAWRTRAAAGTATIEHARS